MNVPTRIPVPRGSEQSSREHRVQHLELGEQPGNRYGETPDLKGDTGRIDRTVAKAQQASEEPGWMPLAPRRRGVVVQEPNKEIDPWPENQRNARRH